MKTRTTSATSNAPRHGPFRAGIAAITALLWVGLLGGCAALSPHEGDGTGAWAESPAWWYAKFRFHWPEDQDTPDWLLDGMVAREVVAPILAAHGDDIRLWRFHRRAARDGGGHQFSFIFYATASRARLIGDALDEDRVLERLRASGRLERVILDDVDRLLSRGNARTAQSATSDQRWRPEVQRHWPHFIQGVSRFWLEMLNSYWIPAGGGEARDLEQRLLVYGAIHERLTGFWQGQGRHALLHHLNALFAYQPVRIQGREGRF